MEQLSITARPLAPGETDHELLWLGVSVCSFAVASCWFVLGLPWPRCVFHDLTGLPCLTCGLTRCAVALFHGDLSGAVRWNPLMFFTFCAVAMFDLYALAALALRTPRLRLIFRSERAKNSIRYVAIAAVLLNWTYLLVNWRQF